MSTEMQAPSGAGMVPVGRDILLSVEQIKTRRKAIQDLMRDVMVIDVHYGNIPGTDKPTLFKAGSEMLLSMFQIGTTVAIENESGPDVVSYRLKVQGIHIPSGAIIGEGVGECSSNETKYKWRKAYESEFNHTSESRRRIVYGWDREKRQEYKMMQVRTEPADMANTVLKMGKKRAQIDMTLTALGCSDMFHQDLEELTEEEREERMQQRQAQKKGAGGARGAAAGGASRGSKPPTADTPQRRAHIEKLEVLAVSPDRFGPDGEDKLLEEWEAMGIPARNLVGAEWMRIKSMKPPKEAAP